MNDSDSLEVGDVDLIEDMDVKVEVALRKRIQFSTQESKVQDFLFDEGESLTDEDNGSYEDKLMPKILCITYYS